MQKFFAGALALALSVTTVISAEIRFDGFPDLNSHLDVQIPKFTAAHPDISVTYQMNDHGDHHKKLTTNLATGSGAGDVVIVDVGFIGAFINEGGFENLSDPAYGADQYADSFVAYAWNQGKGTDGNQYAIPIDVGPGVMYYRRDLFEQLGADVDEVIADWDSYIEFGRKAKEQGIFLIADASDVASTIIRTTVEEGDGLFFDAEGNSLITSPRFVEAFTRAKQIRDEGLDAQIGSWTSEWYTALNGGPLATQLSGSWLIGHLQNWMAPEMAGQWGVSNLPDGIYGSWGGSFLTIPRQAANKADAWEFIKWLTVERQAQIDGMTTIGTFPANITAHDAAEMNEEVAYLGGQKARELFAEVAANVPAVAPREGDLIAEDAVFAGALAEVLNDGKDIEQALADAEALVLRRLR